MTIQINYGSSVLAIPGAVKEASARATATDMRVLLALCAAPTMQTPEEISHDTGLSVDEISASLAFWRGAGILNMGQEIKKHPHPSTLKKAYPDEEKTPVDPPVSSVDKETQILPVQDEIALKSQIEEPVSTVRKIMAPNSLPRYTSQELADLLESRKETSTYLDECQRIWGKMFNVHEHNIILGLTDYL